MILIDAVILILIVFGGIALASFVFGISSRPRQNELISKQDLRALQARDRLAERALVKIASGVAGNAEYEAQSALDERDSLLTKELN